MIYGKQGQYLGPNENAWSTLVHTDLSHSDTTICRASLIFVFYLFETTSHYVPQDDLPSRKLAHQI